MRPYSGEGDGEVGALRRGGGGFQEGGQEALLAQQAE